MSMTFSRQTGMDYKNELYIQNVYPCALTTKLNVTKFTESS